MIELLEDMAVALSVKKEDLWYAPTLNKETNPKKRFVREPTATRALEKQLRGTNAHSLPPEKQQRHRNAR
jgi:hypothetical protein